MSKTRRYLTVGFLALIWILLVSYTLVRTKITLITLIWIGISGVIIFVPLYKRYIKK